MPFDGEDAPAGRRDGNDAGQACTRTARLRTLYDMEQAMNHFAKMCAAASVCAAVLLLCSPSPAARLSADDFIPPVQAESDQQEADLTKIQDPSAVKKDQDGGVDGKPVIRAASAQDAINAFIEEGVPGCRQITFPSGIGFVATGLSHYTIHQNPTATLIEQRNAYVKAYTGAKKELASFLHGISSTGMDKLVQELQTLSTSEKDLSNLRSRLKESTAEAVNGMIRGYVVYNVAERHEGSSGVVTVAIVTTPKTMGGFSRPDLNSIGAASISEGLDHVLAEVVNGIVPPVGGKVVMVPQTGELAYVAFSSAVVRQSGNAAMRSKLYVTAAKTAQMRARSALLGILQGDDISALSSESEETQSMYKEYSEIVRDDPTGAKSEKEYAQLEQAQNTFKSSSTFSEAVTSMRNGVVPPGVTVRTIPNNDKTMITGIAVYLPGMARTAAQGAEKMRGAQPMAQQPGGGQGGIGFSTGEGNSAPGGPSGKVSNDADL